MSYSNNLDRIETIRNDGMIEGADPSIAALSGTVDVRFADTTLLAQATAGDPCELEFAYAIPSGPSFTLTAHAVYLPKPKLALEGPGGVQASFAWQAALDATRRPHGDRDARQRRSAPATPDVVLVFPPIQMSSPIDRRGRGRRPSASLARHVGPAAPDQPCATGIELPYRVLLEPAPTRTRDLELRVRPVPCRVPAPTTPI